MFVSDEIKELLDIFSKITGNTFYLCDLDNVCYISSPEYKSMEKTPLSRDFLSTLLNKGTKIITGGEHSTILKGNEQICILENQQSNESTTSQLISYFEFDDELIGALIMTSKTKNFGNSNIEFCENIIYFLSRCIFYNCQKLQSDIDENEI